ncbi:hypothetical protein BGW36DRAFT_70485 [Talaromyces proteolyticus]|uniref:FAD/NAD(P)-binding domain-containing protein n=1 Tax=Talaromyces proteolyticus TaxID=1131652 RepID=A0AAD4KD90_9EURO|nr:uncharacterized protein BGW36DRAFT_70485 [Talaromyces proteolyticus]KAH8689376.1 hypothetical protein BGW36DRAFT_70485 [Talaromyces proteolyticus]
MSAARITERPARILVIGGSYAGLSVALNLLDLCNGLPSRFTGNNSPLIPSQRVPVEITIVDERDGFYHLIGSPLAFASSEYALKAWTLFQDIPALQTSAVKFVRGSISDLDCEERLATIIEHGTQQSVHIEYDYFVAASGLRRAAPSAPQALSRKQYLLETAEHIRAAEAAKDGVIVVGAGAVGIEMAAELKLLLPKIKVTLIHSRSRILSSEPLPDEFKDLALKLVHEAGVKTILDVRVIETIESKTSDSAPFEVLLSDGRRIKAGLVINAVSKFHPTASYLPPRALDPEGYVKIKPSLQFNSDIPNAFYHHAAGDIVSWSGIKRCGTAMHQGQYAAINIHKKILAQICGITPTYKELAFDVPPMMGLAVGKKAASCGPPDHTVTAGEDVMQLFFGNDLALTICWNYMRLGDAPFKVEPLSTSVDGEDTKVDTLSSQRANLYMKRLSVR